MSNKKNKTRNMQIEKMKMMMSKLGTIVQRISMKIKRRCIKVPDKLKSSKNMW